MKLKSTVKFFEIETKLDFLSLKTKKPRLFKQIRKALIQIEENAFCGIQIPKKLIPKEYIKKYSIKNLWKYNLPKGWRLLYTIQKDQAIILSLVIEWLDHKDYEKLFKY